MPEPKQILYSPVDVDDADFVDFAQVDPKLLEENAEFEKFKAEMHETQDDAKISVSKKLTDSQGQPLGRKSFQCFTCGIDDYDFSQICTRIREEFGTGLYKIQGRDSNGKFKFGKTVGILAPKSDVVENSGNNVGDLIDKFSDAMERQAMRTEQMFSKLVGPQTGGDAFSQMTQMMTAMGGMMGAMGVTPQQPQAPKTLVEQLTEFKMIKELFGGDESSEPGGDANLYTLLGKTVEAFGGPIAQAIAAGAESGALSETGVVALPAPDSPVRGTHVQPTEAEAMTEQEKHNMAMRKNIHILIQNAKAEIPPEAFALILVNNTPEEKENELWDFISAENCVETILKLEPAAEPYKEWFVDLRIAVIDLMTELVPVPEEEIDPAGKDSQADIDPPGKELQADESGSNLDDSETVAGDEEGASPEDSESSGKSDGDTASDT